jgi:general secretion pathway protein F
MPNFRYRAVTQGGDVVTGSISASTAAEVLCRIDYLQLVPIGDIVEERSTQGSNAPFARQPGAEDVTTFTIDLALLLQAGARLQNALELLATDIGIGRLRPVIRAIRANILAGETFADALLHYPTLFSPLYIALVRVGEASATLDILQALAHERLHTADLRRKLSEALRYPAFVFIAAVCVLVFFLTFVLPQFATVLQDFNAKVDPIAAFFIRISEFMLANKDLVGAAAAISLSGGVMIASNARLRAATLSWLLRLPLVRVVFSYHRTALFCRNLSILLAAAVPLTTTLRILADTMASMGEASVFTLVLDRVRHGGKLSEALEESGALPSMAAQMLRVGEETGQLAGLAGRVAEFYESKLHRSLDRIVGLIGPVAIISISTIVGGLIVSVMTSLLSVSQLVG